MPRTLEQELEKVIADADYRVAVVHVSENYLRLRIVYLPKLVVRGEGAFSYISSGLIADHYFCHRNPRKRWRKAREWAQEEIAGHREFVQGVNLV